MSQIEKLWYILAIQRNLHHLSRFQIAIFHFFKGKSKGQKQDNGPVRKKKVNKATQGNHNRRMGSQIKRRQGMIPS